MVSEERKLRRAVALLLGAVHCQPEDFWDNITTDARDEIDKLAWEYVPYLEEDENDGE